MTGNHNYMGAAFTRILIMRNAHINMALSQYTAVRPCDARKNGSRRSQDHG